jgi:hypothetical protein
MQVFRPSRHADIEEFRPGMLSFRQDRHKFRPSSQATGTQARQSGRVVFRLGRLSG